MIETYSFNFLGFEDPRLKIPLPEEFLSFIIALTASST